MGVAGLLKHLRSVTKRTHIREYHGLKAAVDIHCWIHKGSIGCCRELSEGIDTSKFVDYCVEMLKLLVAHGIKPIVVFDGRSLPAKVITNTSRRNSRHDNTRKAREAEADGRHAEAHNFYRKTTTVTPEMVNQVIHELKKHKIEYMVAPYEADAQLAFLSLTGAVDLVITEDSDALVYGCRRVLFKLDKDGSGDEIKRRSLGANQGLSFLNWTDDQFKLMCCIAGCDYVKKIRNIGLVTAHKFVNKYRTFTKTTDALLQSKYDGVDMQYVIQLRRAMNTFKHQTVFNAESLRLQPLTPISNCLTLNYDARNGRKREEDADREYLGTLFEEEDAIVGIVTGALHPYTLKPFNTVSSKSTKCASPMNTKNSDAGCSAQCDNDSIAICNFDTPVVWTSRDLIARHNESSGGESVNIHQSEVKNLHSSAFVGTKITDKREPYCRLGDRPIKVDASNFRHTIEKVTSSGVHNGEKKRRFNGSKFTDDSADDLWKFSFKPPPTVAGSCQLKGQSLPLCASTGPSNPRSHKVNNDYWQENLSSQPRPQKKRPRTLIEKNNPGFDFVPLPLDMLHRRNRGLTLTVSPTLADEPTLLPSSLESIESCNVFDFKGVDCLGWECESEFNGSDQRDVLEGCALYEKAEELVAHSPSSISNVAHHTSVDLDCDHQNGIIRFRPTFSACLSPVEYSGDDRVNNYSLRDIDVEGLLPYYTRNNHCLREMDMKPASQRDEAYWDSVLASST